MEIESNFMKRVIKSSEDSFHTKIITYNVEVQLVSEVEAAINPIQKEDGSIDQAALAEYQEFLINVLAVLDEHEFEIIEDHESPRSETSYYISAFKKSESTSDNIKCVFFIRVSDHVLNKDTNQLRSEYYKSEAERLKQPKSKKKQTWRLKNIVVNGDTFDSYDAAIEEIGKRLN